MKPNNKELAIRSKPFEVEVPKIFSKVLLFKISELIKVISSKTEYKLLSIEEKRFSKIEFIVSIIISVMLLEFSK